jgi:hypothetical protein
MRATSLLIMAAMAVGLLGAVRADAQIVFSENFNGYADTAAVQAAWTSTGGASGLGLTNSINFTPTGVSDQSGLSNLGRFNSNQFATKALATNIAAGKSWSISIDATFETYSRTMAFGLTDSTGAGYVLRWNATNVWQNSGRGSVSIHEHSGAFAATNDTTRYGVGFAPGTNTTLAERPTYTLDGTSQNVPTGSPTGYTQGSSSNGFAPVIGYRRNSGTDAQTQTTYELTYPDTNAGSAGWQPSTALNNDIAYVNSWQGLVTWTLKYDAVTGILSLFNDSPDNPNHGIPTYRVLDPTPLNSITWSQFYLSGQSADFDNIVVAVPEPTSLGLLAVGAWGLMRRRRPC